MEKEEKVDAEDFIKQELQTMDILKTLDERIKGNSSNILDILDRLNAIEEKMKNER